MSEPADSREKANELIVKNLAGLQEDGSEVLDRLCKQHPELSEELRSIYGILTRFLGILATLRKFPPCDRPLTSALSENEELRCGFDSAPQIASDPGEPQTLSPVGQMNDGPAGTRYEVLGEVGRGGMGAVFKVWDPELRRKLALKVILGKRCESRKLPIDPVVLGRFLDEAMVTAQLDHPGIVPIHELGVDSSGSLYFTMGLVKGRTLSEILEAVKNGEEDWSLTRLLNVVLKVCETMAYAHERGVVHRDLKPSNIIVGRFGEVYVLDWGLAKVQGKGDRRDLRLRESDRVVSTDIQTIRETSRALDPDDPVQTMDGTIMGTPAYMSLEQARGDVKELCGQTDVYSLGAIIYHLVANAPPYITENTVPSPREIWMRVLGGAPNPLDSVSPSVPPEVKAICEKAMARRKSSRYRDTDELHEDLRAYLECRPVAAYESGSIAELRKWGKRHPLAAFVVCVALSFAPSLLLVVASLVDSDNALGASYVGAVAILAHEKGARSALFYERIRRLKELRGISYRPAHLRFSSAHATGLNNTMIGGGEDILKSNADLSLGRRDGRTPANWLALLPDSDFRSLYRETVLDANKHWQVYGGTRVLSLQSFQADPRFLAAVSFFALVFCSALLLPFPVLLSKVMAFVSMVNASIFVPGACASIFFFLPFEYSMVDKVIIWILVIFTGGGLVVAGVSTRFWWVRVPIWIYTILMLLLFGSIGWNWIGHFS